MAWSKGAVVIVKRGDPNWADSIEKSMNIQKASIKEVEEMQKSNKYCFFPKRHTSDELKEMIEDAEKKYGKRWDKPNFLKTIEGWMYLFVYQFIIFVDKYVMKKGED